MEQNPREIARANWGEARRLNQNIKRKIEDLKNGRNSTNYTFRFEEVENLLKELRLACVQVIFHDFQYAVDKDAETSLWLSHTFLNQEYRKVLAQLGTLNQVVQKRKVDKLYRDFLKTSQSFYRTYIQRLCASFYIPELWQAARGLQLEQPEVCSQDVSPELRAMVTSACYMTLVRLGDLARYRCEATDKPSKANVETALTYYSLANMVDPHDGSSHHQMAVLYRILSQQLEIMYHFHRSISIAKPYKIGPTNLEKGFKSLENQSVARRGAAKDPSETMTIWFLKLHASYYQGELFNAQSELEEEVLHRLEMSMKTGGNGMLVLKMCLINIAAYDIALNKVKANWTMSGSQSCQFILRFNVRTLLVLLRLLQKALQEDSSTAVEANGNFDASGADECSTLFPESLERLLPLLRIYIAWIYVSRADFVEYQEYLEPHIREVYRLLADTLTRLFVHVNSNQGTIESKYLLPEDIETIGLRPLSDRKLPVFLNLDTLETVDAPKRRNTLKARKEVYGRQFKPQTETLWRIRDIVCCGIYLAGSGKFPIAMCKTIHATEAWWYTDDINVQDSVDEATMSQSLVKLKLSTFRASSADDVTSSPYEVPTDSSTTALRNPIEHRSNHLAPSQNEPMKQKCQKSAIDSDLSEDSEMVKMVDNLLATDEEVDPVSHQAGRRLDAARGASNMGRSSQGYADTTYGMDSPTANDVFGGLLTRSNGSPTSVQGKQTTNLPWGYFYNQTKPEASTPKATNGALDQMGLAAQEAFQRYPPRVNGPLTNIMVRPFDQYFVSGASTPPPRASPAAQRPTTSSPNAVASSRSLDNATAQHNAALENLKSTLIAQYGTGAMTKSPSAGFSSYSAGSLRSVPGHSRGISGSSFKADTRGSQDTATFGSPENNGTRRVMERQEYQPMQYGISQSPRKLSEMEDENPIGSRSATRGVRDGFASPTSPAGYTYGYQRPAPINSASAFGAFVDQIPSVWDHNPGASTSSLAFSHPSSLWTGTPGPPPAPAGSIGCNGNYFNGSTPFGRLGDVNNRDDPTHFRNRMKTMFGDDTISSYDKQILEAAMADDYRPRQK